MNEVEKELQRLRIEWNRDVKNRPAIKEKAGLLTCSSEFDDHTRCTNLVRGIGYVTCQAHFYSYYKPSQFKSVEEIQNRIQGIIKERQEKRHEKPRRESEILSDLYAIDKS